MARYPSHRKPGADRPPLDRPQLEALAVSYLARYATTRAKLAAYLTRKAQQRGYAGDEAAGGGAVDDGPPIEAIVARMAALGYIDDRAFAEMRGQALGRRGYGARRVGQALQAAGVSPEDGATARALADADALVNALAYARRRRIGPYSTEPTDPERQRRAIAAMVRAGHGFALARRIAEATPGEELDDDSG